MDDVGLFLSTCPDKHPEVELCFDLEIARTRLFASSCHVEPHSTRCCSKIHVEAVEKGVQLAQLQAGVEDCRRATIESA